MDPAARPDSVPKPVELVATLLTDLPLDERTFHGLLLDISHSTLAGAISPYEMEAIHSFGDADFDDSARDIRVRVREANTTHRSALVELSKHGFRPVTALQFETAGDADSREDAWALCSLYAAEVQGWVLTHYISFDQAARRLGDEEGLLHVPIGGKHRSVLISFSALKQLIW